jgi:hypothetical protein
MLAFALVTVLFGTFTTSSTTHSIPKHTLSGETVDIFVQLIKERRNGRKKED